LTSIGGQAVTEYTFILQTSRRPESMRKRKAIGYRWIIP